MLKSTHKPAPAAGGRGPLPSGWSEHTAPTGHKYYYNEFTKESTYRRPELAPLPPAQPQGPSLADPKVANAYLAQFRQPNEQSSHNRRGGTDGRPKPQPNDKPRRKEPIPGCEPWILVYTKYSRRFVYNPEKNTSYWRIPEKLMPGILELDKARIRGKADEESSAESKAAQENGAAKGKLAPAKATESKAEPEPAKDYDSSEYEEVEVTDDEEAGDGPDGPSNKRQKTENETQDGPLEFTEDDIALQLQAMNEEYGMDPDDLEGADGDDWAVGEEDDGFSEEDAKFLFKDLLDDHKINPYSPWDKLIEDGVIIDDPRYLALSTTKARKECWDEWTRERIADLKEQRARQEKKDPKIAYLALLQDKATPKLYWPEFKRKYKKEAAMKDLHITDKDREKAYREHINRLKLPQSTLKTDLTALLKAQPIHLLNNQSSPNNLPPQILADLRYISLDPKTRDSQIAAYIQTLPPPPEDVNAAVEDEEARKAGEARRRREKALEDRNRHIDEQRRQRERELAISKARMRDSEREIENATRVGKRGLQGQLADMRMQDAADEPAETKEA